jgi:hypothetical protein
VISNRVSPWMVRPFGIYRKKERVELDYVSTDSHRHHPTGSVTVSAASGKSIYSFRANEMFGRGDGVEPSHPDDAGKHMAKVAFLIRARSVVQVHPGPP